MKSWLCVLALLASVSIRAQERRTAFSADSVSLTDALRQIETAFDVRYSYADSTVVGKRVSFRLQEYTLLEIHDGIGAQTGLSVVGINGRYYSVVGRRASQAERLSQVIVTGFLSKGIDKFSRKLVIRPQKVAELPGITDADLLQSLHQLPGVKSPNETATGLHVRGGTPDQNLLLWDGIRLYHPGHLFGMISPINPSIVDKTNFYNKAVHPRFGERVSGIIDIRTSDSVAKKLTAGAGLNGLAADGWIKSPLAKNLGMAAAARQSFTQGWQSPTFDALAEKVFQNTDFAATSRNRFAFADYEAKVQYTPNPQTRLSASAILIDNALDYASGQDGMRNDQQLDIRNHGFSVAYSQQFGSFFQNTLMHYSEYTFAYDEVTNAGSASFEGFSKRNRAVNSGIAASLGWRGQKLQSELGYQLSGTDLSHSFVSKQQGLAIELDRRATYGLVHAGFASMDYKLDGWDLQLGMRGQYFASLEELSFEPRVSLGKGIGSNWQALVSYERRTQVETQIRETATGDLSLENYVWVLADGGDYPIVTSGQFSAGVTYKDRSLLVDADAYYKTLVGVTSLTFGFLDGFDSTVRSGEGFTKGFDILIQKNMSNWKAWASYTYQDSQNRYDGLNGGGYFPIASSIRHAVSIAVNRQWKRFSIGAGWMWHSGKPYSSVGGGGEIVEFNDHTLPDYHRLNLSATYEIKKPKWHGKLGFSLYNVYNRKSTLSREYHREYAVDDFASSAYETRDYRSLGFTPNLFVRVAL
jgi:hypothetical protein